MPLRDWGFSASRTCVYRILSSGRGRPALQSPARPLDGAFERKSSAELSKGRREDQPPDTHSALPFFIVGTSNQPAKGFIQKIAWVCQEIGGRAALEPGTLKVELRALPGICNVTIAEASPMMPGRFWGDQRGTRSPFFDAHVESRRLDARRRRTKRE